MDMQEAKYEVYVYRKPLAALAALLLILIVVFAFTDDRAAAPVQDEGTVADQIRTGTAPIPEFSTATQAKLEKGPVFHALASYTDRGFEPARITIKRGETVRFTNNSSEDVWIASSGETVALYPRTTSVCGSSDLDSCEPFAPQDFWQFTFGLAGEWHVVNNLDKAKGVVVTVE